MNIAKLETELLKSGKGVNIGTVLFLLGASGSGKTVVARRLAREICWKSCDTDQEILKITGEQKISDVFDRYGEKYFREMEIGVIKGLSEERCAVVVATGGGLPAIPGMIDELNRIGATVYLRADVETLWKRLSVDPRELDDRPLLRMDGKKTLARLLREREQYYNGTAITLNTDLLSVDEVCELLKSVILVHQKKP